MFFLINSLAEIGLEEHGIGCALAVLAESHASHVRIIHDGGKVSNPSALLIGQVLVNLNGAVSAGQLAVQLMVILAHH